MLNLFLYLVPLFLFLGFSALELVESWRATTVRMFKDTII